MEDTKEEFEDKYKDYLTPEGTLDEESNAANSEKYREERRHIEKFFVPERIVPDTEKVETSPSGKYRLVHRQYSTSTPERKSWDCCGGEVYEGERKIAEIHCNYRHFPVAWVEEHGNGHDYLVCNEDYQGQTVIELDTGKRVDFMPKSGMVGFGFCWAAITPHPSKKYLLVDGCYWAAPYELLIVDFSDPMNLPYRIVDRYDGIGAGQRNRWTEEGKVLMFWYDDVRKSDGKTYDDLSDEEQKLWLDDKIETEERRFEEIWEPSLDNQK